MYNGFAISYDKLNLDIIQNINDKDLITKKKKIRI